MNPLTQLIQTTQELISAGQIDFALEGLVNYFREDQQQMKLVRQLQQRLSTLQRHKIADVITPQDYRVTLNQISFDILSYLGDLAQQDMEPTYTANKVSYSHTVSDAQILKSAQRKPAPEPPRQLINELALKKVIPMIGAGLSIAARIAGEGKTTFMPDYYELLSRLLDRVEDRLTVDAETIARLRQLLTEGNSAEVAESMKANLGSEYIFFHELRTILNPIDDHVLGSQAHDLLRTIGFKHLITTNYDRILEKFVCPRHEVITPFDPGAFRIFTQSLMDTAQENDRFLLKMHGDITRPETIPFGEDQLRALYENIDNRSIEFRDFLKNLFKNYTLLFLGFSFKNDSEGYVRFLRNLVKEIGGNTQTHYALVPAYALESEQAREYRKTVTKETGIVFIEYTPDLQHSQVWEFISYLNTGKKDEPLLGNRWAQWYRPVQRHEYLDRQLSIEKHARSVRFLTPKLTNAIATDAFLAQECRQGLLQKIAYGEPDKYRQDVENYILPLMTQRRDNLYKRLYEGSLEVRVLFLSSEFDREMQKPTPNLKERYTELLNMLETPELDIEVRLLDGISEKELTNQATFALIYAQAPKPTVDVATAYASQANLDLFQLHMVEINTEQVIQKTFLFEQYWASAWSEQVSKAYIKRWLEKLD